MSITPARVDSSTSLGCTSLLLVSNLAVAYTLFRPTTFEEYQWTVIAALITTILLDKPVFDWWTNLESKPVSERRLEFTRVKAPPSVETSTDRSTSLSTICLPATSERRSRISHSSSVAEVEPLYSKKQRMLEKLKEMNLGRGITQIRDAGFSGAAMVPKYWSESLGGHKSVVSLGTTEVKYLSEHARCSFKITLDDGLILRDSEGNILASRTRHESDGRCRFDSSLIFVMGPDQTLYAGSEKVGEFHHSSFLSGAPVICAGTMETDNTGKLIKISNDSGHYEPSQAQFAELLHLLVEKRPSLGDVRVRIFDCAEALTVREFLERIPKKPTISLERVMPSSPRSISVSYNTGFGHEIEVRGTGPGMSWEKGIPLSWHEGNIWKANLPAGDYEFKLVFVQNKEKEEERFIWEDYSGNRSSTSLVIDSVHFSM